MYGVKTSNASDITMFVTSFDTPFVLSEKSSGFTIYIIKDRVTLNIIKTARSLYILSAMSAMLACDKGDVLAIATIKLYNFGIWLYIASSIKKNMFRNNRSMNVPTLNIYILLLLSVSFLKILIHSIL